MRRWLTLLLPLVAVSAAIGYTVDCDPERADCERALKDLKKMTQQIMSTIPSSKSAGDETSDSIVKISPAITETTTAIMQYARTPLDVFTNPNSTQDFNFSEWAHVFDDNSKEIELNPSVLAKNESEILSKDENSFGQRARALNLSLDELQTFANSIHGHSNASQNGRSMSSDLSDVSLDGDDSTTEFPMELHEDEGRILNKPIQAGIYNSNVEHSLLPGFAFLNGNSDTLPCTEDGITYRLGQKFRKGCEEECDCGENGPQCSPICQQPYFRKGRRLPDPLCSEKPVDDCCALLVCASDNSDRKMPGYASCKFGNTTYAVGSKWNVGCEEVCVCESNSMVNCTQRCPELPVREHCVNVPDPIDHCCQLQLCDVSQDVHEESIKDMMSDERHRMDNTNLTMAEDRVGPAVNEITSFMSREPNQNSLNMEPINSIKVLANNSVQINIFRANTSDNPIHLQISKMGGNNWRDIMLTEYNLLLNMEPGQYNIKSLETGKLFNFTIPNKAKVMPEGHSGESSDSAGAGCSYEGKVYAIGDEYHKGCKELCECIGPEKSECNPIQCPSMVGLDVLEPSCVTWVPEPPDFKPVAPHCCPRTMRCLSNGSCLYEGHTIANWGEVPLSLSGCERRCFCDTGVIDCQPNCAPLPALPPAHLRCPPGQHPALVESLVPGDDCCKQWGCITKESNHPGLNWIQTNHNNIPLPPGFLPTIPPNDENPFVVNNDFDALKNQLHGIPTDLPTNEPQHILDILLKKKMLSVVTLESDSPTSVKMMFGLPQELVGMRGSVDLRYTDSDDKNVSNWESQVFAPADEILGTARLEFRLPGLKPSTVYHIQAKLYLHGRSEQPVSSVYTVKTLDEPVVEEKRILVDSGLSVTDLNATNALLSWRRFAHDELVYIDALQIRYRPVEQAIFSTTELLHSSRMSVQLHSLKPNTQYEAALILVPPVGGQVELFDPRSIPFLTPPRIDIYDWPVEVETDEIGSNSVSLKWKGIPSPPEKFVSVYRAVHACEGSTVAASDEDNNVFKLAVRDHKPTIFITGLQPGTRCRVWIELFLTNGKQRTSNILDILTKPADSHEDIDNIVEVSGVAATGRRSDYYGPLVVVAVLAALATMSALLLLLVLLRRHRPHSVPITTTVPSAPRALPSLPPYDNPSYKLELQQETMNL